MKDNEQQRAMRRIKMTMGFEDQISGALSENRQVDPLVERVAKELLKTPMYQLSGGWRKLVWVDHYSVPPEAIASARERARLIIEMVRKGDEA